MEKDGERAGPGRGSKDDILRLQARIDRLEGTQAHRGNYGKVSENYDFIYSPAVNLVIGIDGTILEISKLSAGQLGYDEEEMVGKNLMEFVIPEHRERMEHQLKRDFRGDYIPGIEVDVFARDGTVHTLLFSPGQEVLFVDERPSSILFTGIDITERKIAEEALGRISAEQEIILNTVPAMIWYKDTKNRIMRANRAAARSLALTPEEIVGRSAFDLFPGEAERHYSDDLDVIGSGEPKLGTIEQLLTATGERMWVRTDRVPYRDHYGNVAGIIVFSVDITERKRMEEELKRYTERLEEEVNQRTSELIQAEKMAAIGHLVAGVAHEINNPLAFVKSKSSRISEEVGNFLETCQDPEVRELLEMISRETTTNLNGINRIATITQALKRFSRPDVEGKSLTNINEGIEYTLVMMANQFKHRVAINTEYGQIPKMECNIGQLNQVFMNLMLNASESMDEGELWIKTWKDGQNIYIEIKDNGRGIPPANIDRIFDPFFTTKGSGTGLGLSISYRIIQDHGGDIGVDSEPGKGTSMTIRLPCTEVASRSEYRAWRFKDA